MALAQDESSGDRFYSLSAQIQREHNAYYDALESALRGTLDITKWVLWFAGCLTRAIQASEKVATQGTLNERQKRVLWRLLGDFEGNLNLRKYIAITKVSEATAQRDLSDLVDSGILKVEGKARATRYLLKADARMARDIRHR
jgi:Fic family protein